jgi:predicted nucleic acid-binding protein
VTRYLLDTTIISEATKPVPSESLSAWLAHQSDDDLHISSLTIAEIRRGILEKPKGRLAGKPSSDLDMIMAAVAEVNDCSLVTDNEKHFPGIPVLNPLRRPR